MKVSIMQPNIFMWSGLLKSLLDSDYHIILDVVKASKNSRYNRNKIAGNQKSNWLTIPFLEFSRNNLIKDLRLNTSVESREKISNLFYSRYKSSPYFEISNSILKNTINTEKSDLLLLEIYDKFLESLKFLDIKICKTIRASELISQESCSNLFGVDLVNYLLDKVKAKTYLASANSLNYAKRSDYFVDEVLIQKFTQSYYVQTIKGNSKDIEFEGNLSCLDLLSFISLDELDLYLEKSNKWNKI